MEEALKQMARKPNLKELNEKATFRKRMSASLHYNSLTKLVSKLGTTAKGPTVFEIGPYLTRPVHFTMLGGAVILGLGFYSSVLVTMTRKETFARNHALIEQKYGEKHREAFGEDAKINKMGYPDMGNNLFSDLLPYKDWVKMNNAQRMHESGYEYTLVFLPNAFITALSFPKTAAYMTAFYAIARFNHINSYTSSRGYNAAMLHEELMRFDLILVLFSAFVSGARISGVMRPLTSRIGPRLTAMRTRVSNLGKKKSN